MSNFLNFALGGLTGALSGSPLQSLTGSPLQALVGSLGGGSGMQSATGALAGVMSRDGQMPELGDITSSMNLLQQAANALESSAGSSAGAGQQLDLPPLAPMPAPAKPTAVATDDHGQSNIVFSDAGVDGSLVH